MKLFLVLALLISTNAFAAQRLTSKGISYFPTFGVGSTSSVSYTGAQGSVGILAQGGQTYELVRIYATTAAYIDIGANPNPSSAKMPIAANTELVVEVLSGHRIGALQQSAAGTLYVTRLPINKD